MAFWNRKTKEQRAESGTVQGMVQVDDPLLKALVGGGAVTREMALQVPTVSGGIDLIAGVVAGTPIKLYRDEGGKAVEVTDDVRLRLLNDETGDTLNANEFWRAMIADYYLGKGGFAYIHRQRGRPCSLHYVREEEVSLTQNSDPIFKSYNILVGGRMYYPFDFVKILRATRDGMRGVPITEESGRLIETAYSSLVFERNMVRRGGNKKGFLKSEKKLEQGALDKLREAFSRLYSNGDENSENFVVLNNGIDFKESSNTSVELQLNENKLTNAGEFAKIFHISTEAISGKAADTATLAKLAAIPLMKTIQCALNRDLLLENEKADHYFAFDTKELLRGDMAQRFAAYKTALEANFMQIDEIRYAEDLEPLGMNWIKLGLQDVLYDPKTGEVFAPNTGNRTMLGEKASGGGEETPPGESEDDPAPPGEMEQRGNGRNYIKGPDGRFMGSRPDVGNSDSVPVPAADYMGQPVTYQVTVPGRDKPLKIKAYQNESYGNFWCQTNSKNSQAICAYLNRIINEEKRYGEIDRIVVAKHKSLQGVAAYDHLSNRFFVSEELIDETRFSEICDSGYFAAQCLDDVLIHELGGHKAHWDAVKRYWAANDSAYKTLEDAKNALERNLREYVARQIGNDLSYLIKAVSVNSYDAFIRTKGLNEVIADVIIKVRRGRSPDRELRELVEEVISYDVLSG